jgi:hypothetical protein
MDAVAPSENRTSGPSAKSRISLQPRVIARAIQLVRPQVSSTMRWRVPACGGVCSRKCVPDLKSTSFILNRMARDFLIRSLAGVVVACGMFAWLDSSNALNEPATIIVNYDLSPREGAVATRPIPAELRFGRGPDEAEHGVSSVRLDVPNYLLLKPVTKHVIRVERVGRKSDAAIDSQVWIVGVVERGTSVPPDTLVKAAPRGTAIELLESGASATFCGNFQALQLELLQHDWSGVARITADDGEPLEIDLYSPKPASRAFLLCERDTRSDAVIAQVPHRDIRRVSLRALDAQDRFRVTGLTVLVGDETRRIPIPSSQSSNEWRYRSPHGLSATRHPTLTGVHVVMAVLIGWIAAVIFGRLINSRMPKDARPAANCSAAAFAIVILLVAQAIFWLAGAWPAFFTTDSFSVWRQTQDLKIDSWLSHTYVLFVLMTRQLWDSPATLSIIQVALSFAIAASIFLGLLRYGLRPIVAFPFVLLFATAVPVGAYALYHTRDTLFGLTSMAIAAVTYFWGWRALYGPPFSPSRSALLALALVAGFHATLRTEGELVLVLLPILLWLVVHLRWRRIAAFVLVSGTLCYVSNTPLIRALGVQTSPFYGLTTKLDPLGAIVSGNYNTDNPARDREIIEKIVPLDRLKERHKNIAVYWDGSMDSTKIGLEDLRAFERLYFTLVRKNLRTFLENRCDNFARLCCSDDQSNLGGMLNLGFEGPLNVQMNQMGLNEQATVPFPALRDFVSRLLWASLEVGQSPIDWRSILWNLWPAVALTIAAVVAFRSIPVTAAAALLVAYRLPVIFAAAPASMFKYLYDVYLLGFFLIPMALLEIGVRNRRLARYFMQRTSP